MSRIAFDCDGVLGYDGVDIIRQLAQTLKMVGWEVYIITAVPKDWMGTNQRESMLDKLFPGFPYRVVYTNEHEEAGRAKAKEMKELGITLLIDDTIGVCEAAKAEGVQVLHLLK
ncbi:MAG: HAD family hydrolase [Nitrosotalea sp.]